MKDKKQQIIEALAQAVKGRASLRFWQAGQNRRLYINIIRRDAFYKGEATHKFYYDFGTNQVISKMNSGIARTEYLQTVEDITSDIHEVLKEF